MERLQGVDPLLFVGIGLLATSINFLGSYEVQKIQNKECLKAASAAALTVLLANALLYIFISNPLYGISEAAGAFAGTLIQVHLSKHGTLPKN